MSRTAAQVLDYLLSLTPPGAALPLSADGDANWPILLMPLAGAISTFEASAESMFVEVDPATAVNLLTDYERVLGPDPYGRDVGSLTTAQRQALAHSRWTQKCGVRPADFIGVAESFGVTATITEYQLTTAPFFAGAEVVNHPAEFEFLMTLPTGNPNNAFIVPFVTGRTPARSTAAFAYD